MSKEVKDSVVPNGIELYAALNQKVINNRENFCSQVIQLAKKIELCTQELEQLKIKKFKLEGAIEASDLLLPSTASLSVPPSK